MDNIAGFDVSTWRRHDQKDRVCAFSGQCQKALADAVARAGVPTPPPKRRAPSPSSSALPDRAGAKAWVAIQQARERFDIGDASYDHIPDGSDTDMDDGELGGHLRLARAILVLRRGGGGEKPLLGAALSNTYVV